MTSFFGVLLDAWDEVRVHRARVVLSLIGIVLAVFAMTATTAAGMIFRQIVQEQTEAYTGRSATLSLYASSSGEDGREKIPTLYDAVVQRYQVKYSSQVIDSGNQVNVPGRGSTYVSMTAVDPDWGVIHRLRLTSGRWLGNGDGGRLAPSVVMNKTFLETLGENPERPAPFTVKLPAPVNQSVVVVGVTDREDPYNPHLWMLRDDGELLLPQYDPGQSSLELWVPPDSTEMLVSEINRLTRAAGLDGQVNPPDDAGLGSVLTGLQVLILALSLFGLFLGALGVLNVGVVTVRQRVREIGVKRALGASSGRIFAAIMLESVFATVLAGLLGIALAVALVNNFPWTMLPAEIQPTENVPFPFGAAIQGFTAATVVGALAGLVPAIIAVRSKVIDAIRY